MFDVGFWELALLGIIALVIIGPERLPAAARTVGLWVGKARRMLREASADIKRELNEQDVADLNAFKESVENAGKEFEDANTRTTDSLKESFQQASPLKPDTPAAPKEGVKKVAKKTPKKTSEKTAKKPVAKKVAKKGSRAKTAAPKPRA